RLRQADSELQRVPSKHSARVHRDPASSRLTLHQPVVSAGTVGAATKQPPKLSRLSREREVQPHARNSPCNNAPDPLLLAGAAAQAAPWCAHYSTGLNDGAFYSYRQCRTALSGVGGICLQNGFEAPYWTGQVVRRRHRGDYDYYH